MYYLQGISIYKSYRNGTVNYYYAIFANNLGLLYQKLGKYSKVEPLFIESKDIYEKLFGKEHQIYALCCNNVATHYEVVCEYSKAEDLYIEARNISARTLGKEHPEYATTCNNLGELYKSMGYYTKAEELIIEAKEIFKINFETNKPGYALACNNLAQLYKMRGEYSKAEKLYKESKSIRKKALGTEHPDYAASCSNLAELYRTTNRYAKAELLLLEARNIYINLYGKEHPEYATNCCNLALLYDDIGNYIAAEQLYIEALSIDEIIFGKQHPEYGYDCINLASLYLAIGDYQKAEALYFETRNIFKNTFGTEHPDYAKICNNLAALYFTLGNYPKAEELLIEAKNIDEKILGKQHPDYAIDCNNLAVLYQTFENYSKALSLFNEAKNITEMIYGNKHLYYSLDCSNLASIHSDLGNYEQSEQLYIEAKAIRKNILGKQHPNYATSCNNLASLYLEIGNYSKAEPLFLEAKKIREKVIGKEHPDYATTCNSLAILYMIKNNFSKAKPLILEANKNIDKQVHKSGTFMSESERELFLMVNINFHYNFFYSFYLNYKMKNPKLSEITYNNALLMKGLLLRSNIVMRQAVLNSGDQNLINIYNDWILNGTLLAKLESMPISERNMDIDSLHEVNNNFEKQLVASNLSNFKNLGGFNWHDVQNSLLKDEVAIEFIHFNYYDDKYQTDSVYYCALIIRKESKQPEMIYLFEQQELQNILTPEKYITNEDDNISDLYQTFKTETKSDSLYKLIWKPIDKHLQGINTIYISPSGLLLTIPIHAIPVNNSDTLLVMDKYNLSYLSTTANIIQQKKLYQKDIENAVLFGGIDYSADTTAWKVIAMQFHEGEEMYSRSLNTQVFAEIAGTDRGGYEIWQYLESTAKERKIIFELLEKSKIPTQYYKEIEATEEVFKSLSNEAPDVLHIATHGFYFPQVKQNRKGLKKMTGLKDKKYIHAENPLVRSGLVFAGANYSWNNNQIEGIDDGTLSAYEVSQLNLIGCKLVVLSACQIGLGDVNGSEGIYGLQRAFKMAGVDYIIYTLWSVDDYATQLFMATFYNNIFAGMEITEAFEKAQLYLRTKTNEVRYWAPFVLLY